MTKHGLTYLVHIAAPVPFRTTDKAPNGDPRMFQPIATTLIHGATDAVLVDPPMTMAQAEEVGDWIAATGRTLRGIYVTHGHGDHWFAAGPLLERFPGVPVLASPSTIAVMRFHASAQGRAIWEDNFGADLLPPPESVAAVRPTCPAGGRFELEGHELRVVEVGHTDTDATTVLHVPSIDLVIAGDAVYNGIHLYLAETADGGLHRWLAALEQIAALRPSHVVAGHKNPALPDVPAAIAQTAAYLRDVETVSARANSAREFFDAMLELHPDRLNPSALWFWGALVLFPSHPGQGASSA